MTENFCRAFKICINFSRNFSKFFFSQFRFFFILFSDSVIFRQTLGFLNFQHSTDQEEVLITFYLNFLFWFFHEKIWKFWCHKKFSTRKRKKRKKILEYVETYSHGVTSHIPVVFAHLYFRLLFRSSLFPKSLKQKFFVLFWKHFIKTFFLFKIVQYQAVKFDFVPLSPVSRTRLCKRKFLLKVVQFLLKFNKTLFLSYGKTENFGFGLGWNSNSFPSRWGPEADGPARNTTGFFAQGHYRPTPRSIFCPQAAPRWFFLECGKKIWIFS